MKKIVLALCVLSSIGFTGCFGKSEIEKREYKNRRNERNKS